MVLSEARMRSFVCLMLVALLSACTPLKQYTGSTRFDEQCRTEDPSALELAQSTADMAPEGHLPSDPTASRDKALDILESKGIRIVKKPKLEGHWGLWSRMTTTLPDVIFVGSEWDSYPVVIQAEVLWHELVHVRQWERFGSSKFAFMYAIDESRWALEVVAYRESFRVLKTMGVLSKVLEAQMESRMESLYTKYFLAVIPKQCFEDLTSKVWEKEL